MGESREPELHINHPLVISPRLSQLPRILNTMELKRESFSMLNTSGTPPDIERFAQTNNDYDVAEIRSVRQLLINLHRSARLNADVHYESLKHYESMNLKSNIMLLTISLIASVISPVLDNMKTSVSQIFTSASLTLIGGLGVILNRLGFQTKIEKHRQARESFIEIVDLIEMAMAYANEEEASRKYDFTHVLNEVQQIRHNLNKFAPPISDEVMEIVLDRMAATGILGI